MRRRRSTLVVTTTKKRTELIYQNDNSFAEDIKEKVLEAVPR